MTQKFDKKIAPGKVAPSLCRLLTAYPLLPDKREYEQFLLSVVIEMMNLAEYNSDYELLLSFLKKVTVDFDDNDADIQMFIENCLSNQIPREELMQCFGEDFEDSL